MGICNWKGMIVNDVNMTTALSGKSGPDGTVDDTPSGITGSK